MDGKYIVLISIILNVIGQYSMKFGMNRFGPIEFNNHIFINLIKIFTHFNIIIGLLFYGISAIFWLIALSKIELSTAYPMLSIGYILIFMISYFFLNENIGIYKILGIILIICGLFFISK